MINVKVHDCATVDQFWDAISPVGRLFNSEKFLFRGQRLSTWHLQPGIFRDPVARRLRTANMAGMLADHQTQTWLEASLLATFVEACDVQGLAIPGDSLEFREFIAHTMKRHGADNSQWPDVQLHPLIALAQHHGLPTRLLDVTRNPFVAAYFAAADAVSVHVNAGTGPEQIANERIAVFGFDMEEFRRVPDISWVKVAGSTSANLRAQAGSFLLLAHHGTRGQPYEAGVSIEAKLPFETGRIPDEDDEHQSPPFIHKVTLPAVHAAGLLKNCRRHTISATTMFPSYDGAVRDVLEMVQQVQFLSRYELLRKAQ